MRKFFAWLKKVFLPPPGTHIFFRLLPFGILGILTIFSLTGTAYAWEYTNSTEFCGTSCHTMPPEYSAYLRSPHARVQCVECHIGRDVVTTQFSRKAGDLRHVVLMVTQQYEYPIHSHNMRPARDSCETCHFPEKFSDDSLREIRSYQNDEKSTPESLFLILKTGGGAEREGLGQGIHWHIENEVYYYATDDLEQDIPYIRTVDKNGAIKEYYDVASEYTPELIAGKHLVQMDCISCHNRITHSIPHPEEAIDQAITKNLIDDELPFIRREAVDRLGVLYPTNQEGLDSMNSLATFYQENYPEIYAEKQGEIENAIAVMQDLYAQIVFRDQKIDWNTYPNNLGHKTDPGCFRCHDGKHLTGEGEAIRLECNVCHSIPVKVDNLASVTNIEVVSGAEPPSHTNTNWMTLHGKVRDSSCIGCHPPNDNVDFTQLEGKPPADGSFCGNEACHSSVWTYAGFDAPALQPILERQLYILLNTSPFLSADAEQTYEGQFKQIFDGRCVFCHGEQESKAGLNLSSYEAMLQGGSTGPGIVPGSPNASEIYVRQTDGSVHFGQMLEDELLALQVWIENDAPEK